MTQFPALSRLFLTRNVRPSVFKKLIMLDSVYRESRRTARLSDTQLKDIGLTREAVQREAAKTDWNAPRHWMR